MSTCEEPQKAGHPPSLGLPADRAQVTPMQGREARAGDEKQELPPHLQ